MNSSNLLVPPPSPGSTDVRSRDQIDLWNASAERIERILPGFLGEVVVPATIPQELEKSQEKVLETAGITA
jgi:brefeldin A-resistance guanine nucleotide exchange factor 1